MREWKDIRLEQPVIPGCYLVNNIKNDVIYIAIYNNNKWSKDFNGEICNTYPTHWQELPKPPAKKSYV